MRAWLVVAAIVDGLTIWGWNGPTYPSTGPVVVHVHHHGHHPGQAQPAPAAPVASSSSSGGGHSHHAMRALWWVLRMHRLARWAFHPHLLPWWLRG